MKIVGYKPKYKNEFIKMNKTWISAMFSIEPEDERELSSIEKYIEKGGQIFFVVNDDEEIMACCMISPRDDGDWEIMKFATKEIYKGRMCCLSVWTVFRGLRKVQKQFSRMLLCSVV